MIRILKKGGVIMGYIWDSWEIFIGEVLPFVTFLWAVGCVIFTILFAILNCLNPSYVSKMNTNELTIIGDVAITIIVIIFYSIIALIIIAIYTFVCVFSVPLLSVVMPGIMIFSLFIYLCTLGDLSLHIFYVSGTLTLIIFIVFILFIAPTLGIFYLDNWEITISIFVTIVFIFVVLFVNIGVVSGLSHIENYYQQVGIMYWVYIGLVIIMWLFLTITLTIMFCDDKDFWELKKSWNEIL